MSSIICVKYSWNNLLTCDICSITALFTDGFVCNISLPNPSDAQFVLKTCADAYSGRKKEEIAKFFRNGGVRVVLERSSQGKRAILYAPDNDVLRDGYSNTTDIS